MALITFCSAYATERFKGEKASIINWSKVRPEEWYDLGLWKKENEVKKLIPDWERNIRETSRTEMVGRVLECSGRCRIYRGLGYSSVQHLSAVFEGDEISTDNDGYLWLYLFDGTIVRLSPQSSMSLQEVNVAKDVIFYFARLNLGNMLWLTRKPAVYKPSPLKETDVLYFPLKLYEANYLEEVRLIPDEDNLFGMIEEKSISLVQYSRLNKLMEERKDQKLKTVATYLVLPNGTIWGKDLALEATVLTGKSSYFKLRSSTQLGQENIEYNRDVSFYFRGFENKGEERPEIGKWYEVGPKGREIQQYPLEQQFAVGEFVTSNIPSIYLAREFMMDRYGDFMHSVNDPVVLGNDYGFRLWTGFEEGGELSKRVSFLKEFTRRIETTNLLSAEKLSKRMLERGEDIENLEYGPRFYERAINRYHIYKESMRLINSDREPLNSELNPFWKRINVYK
ncbi:MAG: hypothetical protein Fur0010_07630 [Bdellovibrio sp.]